ncbi:HTH-type transcriptional repressor CarH [soil metagenome]
MTERPSRQQNFSTIGEVVREVSPLFPDVSHSSLRFLEREGLIKSTRTPGGHRLYPREAVDRIIRIKTWQKERLSLDEIKARLKEFDKVRRPKSLATSFLDSALAGDFDQASHAISRADDVGMPMTSLFSDVLSPALVELGQRWERGEVSTAVEKGVSELSRELIANITVKHAHSDPKSPTVVAACVEGERHELGLRMICGLLREKGYRVYFLGADVLPRFLVDAVELHRPQIVLLSAKLDPTFPAVEAAIGALRGAEDLNHPFRIFVGGDVASQFPDQITVLGATPITHTNPAKAIAMISAATVAQSAEVQQPAV